MDIQFDETHETKVMPSGIYWFLRIGSVPLFLIFFWWSAQAMNQSNWIALSFTFPYMVSAALIFFKTPYIHNKTYGIVYKHRDIMEFKPSPQAERVFNLDKGQYVYVLQDCELTGLCKIGYTNNPSRRLTRFGVELPMKIKLVHILETDNMRHFEGILHNRFSGKRVRGEWFDLSHDDIEYLKSL